MGSIQLKLQVINRRKLNTQSRWRYH